MDCGEYHCELGDSVRFQILQLLCRIVLADDVGSGVGGRCGHARCGFAGGNIFLHVSGIGIFDRRGTTANQADRRHGGVRDIYRLFPTACGRPYRAGIVVVAPDRA